MTWVAATLALLGTWLNVHHQASCFALWLISNAIWAIVDWRAGIHAQAGLHVVYFALSLYGLHRWTSDHHER